jgi:hypothetical protein
VSRRSLALALASALGVGLLGAPARGQDDLGQDAARELYRKGLECFDKGDHTCAADAWRAALRELGAERGFRVHYNLGLTFEAAGDATLAVEHFEAFLAGVARRTDALTPALEERRQDAAERIRKLRDSHGELRIEAPPGQAKVRVAVDDRPPVDPPVTMLLAPGAHRVVVDPGTAGASTTSVTLEAGKPTTVVAERAAEPPPPPPPAPPPLAPAKPAAPPAKPPAREDPPTRFPVLWVLAGSALTAGSLVIPFVLKGDAEDAADEAAALGVGHTGYPAAVERYEDARSDYEVAWILPIVAGTATLAIATVGIVLVATDDTKATAEVGPGRGRVVVEF